MLNTIFRPHTMHFAFTPEQVFALLCPVVEQKWLDGWECTILHSTSGKVEKGCIFTTQQHGHLAKWHVTNYNPETLQIDFLIDIENICRRLEINVMANPEDASQALMQVDTYLYAMTEAGNDLLEKNEYSEPVFNVMMAVWELSMAHYLETGQKISKHEALTKIHQSGQAIDHNIIAGLHSFHHHDAKVADSPNDGDEAVKNSNQLHK